MVLTINKLTIHHLRSRFRGFPNNEECLNLKRNLKINTFLFFPNFMVLDLKDRILSIRKLGSGSKGFI